MLVVYRGEQLTVFNNVQNSDRTVHVYKPGAVETGQTGEANRLGSVEAALVCAYATSNPLIVFFG